MGGIRFNLRSISCHCVSEGEFQIGEASKVRTSVGVFDAVVAATGE